MRRLIRRLLYLLILTCFIVLFSGCYDASEIEDNGYAIAVGLDKGTTNSVRVTLMLAVPEGAGKSGGSGSGSDAGPEGAGSGSSSTSTIVTVEGPSLYGSMNMINASISKQVSFSHAVLLAVSEDLARSGDLEKFIHGIERGREFRPQTNFAIVRGTAEQYINSIKTVLSNSEYKHLDLAFNTFRYTSFSVDSTIFSFYNQVESTSEEAVATLASINKYNKSEEFNNDSSTYKSKSRTMPLERDFYAGDLPRSGGTKDEIAGLAAFSGERMVGILDAEDAAYYLITTGKYNHSYWNIPDPLKKGYYVVINIKQNRTPRIDVKFTGDKPYINLNLYLEGDFVSIQSGINYENPNNIGIIENTVKTFLSNGISNYLNTTTKVLCADINGFGNYAKRNFLFWQDWINSNWLNKYKDSVFKLEVSFKVRRTGMMVMTIMENGK